MPLSLLLLVIVLAMLAIAAVLCFNTCRFASRQVPVEPLSPADVDPNAAAQRLSKAVQFKTISLKEGENPFDTEFTGLRNYLAEQFPLVHAQLVHEVVNERSLLFKWAGTDSSAAGRHALLLMGHQDVVPIEPGTEAGWIHPPFDGAIADGYIWGRGSWDNKGAVLGILEAVENLLRAGFRPQRDIYLAFGHDEEVHGMSGAAKTAELLKSRGVRFYFVLDEGNWVSTSGSFDLSTRLAQVGIEEKGYMSVSLQAQADGGHSSMPPVPTAIDLLAQAILALRNNPMHAKITPAIARMYDFIGPELPWWHKVLIANRWLFGWLVKQELLASPKTSPLVRTTSATTIISAGIKDNVVPSHAEAVVNFRILSGQTVEEVLEHARHVINDPRITLTMMFGTGGPTSSKTLDTITFGSVARTIRQVFPDAIVAPTLLLGRTDSRHFEGLSDGGVYRFTPIIVGPGDAKRLHGTNERIAVDNYVEAIEFYRQLILNSSRCL